MDIITQQGFISYDAGYQDAQKEMAERIDRLEKRIKQLETEILTLRNNRAR